MPASNKVWSISLRSSHDLVKESCRKQVSVFEGISKTSRNLPSTISSMENQNDNYMIYSAIYIYVFICRFTIYSYWLIYLLVYDLSIHLHIHPPCIIKLTDSISSTKGHTFNIIGMRINTSFQFKTINFNL